MFSVLYTYTQIVPNIYFLEKTFIMELALNYTVYKCITIHWINKYNL